MPDILGLLGSFQYSAFWLFCRALDQHSLRSPSEQPTPRWVYTNTEVNHNQVKYLSWVSSHQRQDKHSYFQAIWRLNHLQMSKILRPLGVGSEGTWASIVILVSYQLSLSSSLILRVRTWIISDIIHCYQFINWWVLNSTSCESTTTKHNCFSLLILSSLEFPLINIEYWFI